MRKPYGYKIQNSVSLCRDLNANVMVDGMMNSHPSFLSRRELLFHLLLLFFLFQKPFFIHPICIVLSPGNVKSLCTLDAVFTRVYTIIHTQEILSGATQKIN